MPLEIIAELAQGFEGRPEQARLLLKAAAAAGADAAKFQLVYADELGTPDYKHHGLFRSLEMPDEEWMGLAGLAANLGIRLALDVFGARSLAVAERIGVRTIKLHPTDIANQGFLRQVAASGVPQVLLGAGGAGMAELDQALDVLTDKQVVILAGFQGYPTANEANQIARVQVLHTRYRTRQGVAIGFADHAQPESLLRLALAATAIGAGATVLEKHLTLGRAMKLEDHESALNPDEFAEFCTVVRASQEALGNSSEAADFGMTPAEHNYRTAIRRHVVAARDLIAGTIIVPSDVVLKRTSSNQPLTDPEAAYGRTVVRDVLQNTPVLSEHLR